tara:strand:+ start:193 stop:333 length:141 start_codon:yes stop_codon:yes gene_type:complete
LLEDDDPGMLKDSAATNDDGFNTEMEELQIADEELSGEESGDFPNY